METLFVAFYNKMDFSGCIPYYSSPSNTAAFSNIKPVPTAISCDSQRVHGHDKKNTLYQNIQQAYIWSYGTKIDWNINVIYDITFTLHRQLILILHISCGRHDSHSCHLTASSDIFDDLES